MTHPLLLGLRFLDLFEEVRGEDEIVQYLICGGEYIFFGSLPFLVPFVDEDDFLANAHHRVHVVGVDEGGHVVLACDVLDQGVDDQRCLGVESRVRLVAEEVLRVQRDGACDGHALLHAAADFARIFVAGIRQVDAVEAELGAALAVAQGVVAEHVEGEHHVVHHRHGVEQGGALEEHAHLPAQQFLLLLVHGQEVAVVVEQLAPLRGQQADDALHQHRLSRAALSDDEVRLPVLEGGVDVRQHGFPFE